MRLGGPQSQYKRCGTEKYLLSLAEIKPWPSIPQPVIQIIDISGQKVISSLKELPIITKLYTCQPEGRRFDSC
jgi:hypothetical protein